MLSFTPYYDIDDPFSDLSTKLASFRISSNFIEHPVGQAAVAATVAGGVDTAVTGITHPFFMRKIRQQDPKIPAAEKATWNPKILFQGAAPNMFSMIPITVIQFMVNQGMKSAFHAEGEAIPALNLVGYSGLAGALSALASNPVEKTIAWQNPQRGFFRTGYTIVNNNGLRALWSGLSATALRDTKYVIGYQFLAPFLTKQYSQGMPLIPAQIAGGISAGLVAAIVSHPSDVARSCFHMNNIFEKNEKGQLPGWKQFSIEARNQGYRYVTKGIVPRTCGIAATTVILNTIGEHVQAELKKKKIAA